LRELVALSVVLTAPVCAMNASMSRCRLFWANAAMLQKIKATERDRIFLMVILMKVHRFIYPRNMRNLNGLIQSDYQAVEEDYQEVYLGFVFV
jgi:hypothetical protein